MTPARHKLAKRLFIEAKKLRPEDRVAFLDAECSGQPEVRTEVEELLAAALIPDPILDGSGSPAARSDASSRPGAGAAAARRDDTLDRFGRFEIRANLGVGGMGTVDLAFDPELDRTVAIKRIRPELLASPESLSRFKREALAASRLDHPGLCAVYAVGESEGIPYFVMPVVEGETLASRLADEESARVTPGSPPATHEETMAVVAIVEKVARALHHAHVAGLVHRDVKPANIMVQKDGTPVVLDFGLVHNADGDQAHLTRTGQLPGTPYYMSPEQVRGAGTDCRTDVYSLGVTLYECLTHRRPFEAGTQHELFDQIRNQAPPDPRRLNRLVPRDLAVVVQVAMDKDPARRYRSAEELADDLRRVHAREPIRARGAGWGLRVRRWVARNRSAAALIAVLASGLTVSSVLWSENAGIATHMEGVATREQAHRTRATESHALARRRLRDFDLLAVRVRLDDAIAAATALQPAWPDKLSGLEAWIAEHGGPLRNELPRVRSALRQLEDAARRNPPSAAEAAARGRERASLGKKLAALQLAMDIRTGKRKAEPAQLPADTPDDPVTLVDMAWPLVDPARDADSHGQEELGLALARRAFAGKDGAAVSVPLKAAAGYVVAWALFATGRDSNRRSTNVFGGAPGVAPDGNPYLSFAKRMYDARAAADDVLEVTRRQYALLNDEPSGTTELEFASETDRFLYDALKGIEVDLVALLDDTGTARDVAMRRDWARDIAELTANHPDAPATWEQAALAIARADGVVASELYREHPIRLQPQTGLVPIGMNPATGLWEFYHLRSAFDPRTGASAASLPIPRHLPDGRIDLRPDSGMVFVLVPGGRMPHGAGEETRASGRPRDMEFGPFFIARHELTQGQWMRLSLRDNPSKLPAGIRRLGRLITLLHPVETVSWDMCDALLRHHGLELPAEWSWEYASRAGAATPWIGAERPGELAGRANILDESTHRAGAGLDTPAIFDDGHPFHAPVGTFPANRFGLHETTGNVREFCGNRAPKGAAERAVRGGSFARSADRARLSLRDRIRPGSRGMDLGLRAARAIR